jgi:hypothetical protein
MCIKTCLLQRFLVQLSSLDATPSAADQLKLQFSESKAISQWGN